MSRWNLHHCRRFGRRGVTMITSPTFCSFSDYSSVPYTSSSSTKVPERANVVIVGGGIIGTSLAYHLAKLGVEDILLLEKDRLTSGTTWHAAGLINSFGSLSSTSTEFRKYTKQLYSEILPLETGMSTGWMDIGFIELACDSERLEYYRRIATFNRYCGVDVREIGPEQVKELFPLCDVSHVLAGFHVPSDGRANPTDATMALAKGARMRGVTILENNPVAGVVSSKHGCGPPFVEGVRLQDGSIIQCNMVANCAGMWARQFGQACGVDNIPNQAAEHYYLITEPMDDVDPSWPVIEDASRCVYIRPEGGGLMLGLFEWEGESWMVDGVPENQSFIELEPNWDRMMPYIEKAIEIVPDVQNAGLKKLFCGPESFTPDGNPIVGESAYLRNYFIAAGMNSLGILSGGGIGQVLAQWMKHGRPPSDCDVTAINANRFHSFQSNLEYRRQRTTETLGNTYRIHFPNHQPKTCRNAKRSALHDRLKNAHFRDVSGWESPAWYAPPGSKPISLRESFGRENWFPFWEAEHKSCRENVVLFDMSFMSKFLVQGRDAGAFLNRLSTANVDGNAMMITYTQWLDEKGYIQADLTVIKVNEHEFMVIATDTMHNQVYDHMVRRLHHSEHAFVTDVTARYAQINVQGPRSRQLLETVTNSSVCNEAFPFRHVKNIEVDLAQVLCCRITYVGELGYELLVPVEQACLVYDRIVDAGSSLGLKHAGLKALGSLRMEKGYRDFGHDMDNTDTIFDAGLSFTCDFDKPIPFIGQEQVMEQQTRIQKEGGRRKRLVSVFVTDPDPMLHHGEILYRKDQAVADIRAGTYGHTLGGSVGLAMLQDDHLFINSDYIGTGDWKVRVGNESYPVRLSFKPLYDPKGLRVTAA